MLRGLTPMDDATVSSFDEFGDMGFVGVHSLTHFVGIGVPVIHGRHATQRPRDMIEQLFGDMDWGAKSRKLRAVCSPQVVKGVWRNTKRFIKFALSLAPPGKRSVFYPSRRKQQVGVSADARNNLVRERSNRKPVLPLVLAEANREGNRIIAGPAPM